MPIKQHSEFGHCKGIKQYQTTVLPQSDSSILPIYLFSYVFICLHIYFHTYLHIYLSSYLSIFIYTYLYTYQPSYLSINLHIYLCLYILIFIPIYLHISLSLYLHIYQSIYQSIFISINISQCGHVYLSYHVFPYRARRPLLKSDRLNGLQYNFYFHSSGDLGQRVSQPPDDGQILIKLGCSGTVKQLKNVLEINRFTLLKVLTDGAISQPKIKGTS